VRTVRISSPHGLPDTTILMDALTGLQIPMVRMLRPYTIIGNTVDRWKGKLVFVDGTSEDVYLIA